MTRFGMAVLVTALSLPGAASAACDEQGGLVCGSGAPRVNAEAGLQVSRGGNFSPLSSGAGLRSGDRVLTGDAGATVVLGPSCARTVGPGALVSFTRIGGRTCASVTEPPAGPVVGNPGVSPVILGLGAGTAAVIGFGLATSGNDGRTPPPTVSAR